MKVHFIRGIDVQDGKGQQAWEWAIKITNDIIGISNMNRAYNQFFVIMTLIVLVALPAHTGRSQVAVTMQFRDHRAQRMDDIGSRLPASTLGTDQPLAYAKYSALITQIDSSGEFRGSETVSGYLDENGRMLIGFLESGDYILTMLVELESQIDGLKFHRVVKESDENLIYRQVSATPFSLSPYGPMQLNLNVSCPNFDCNLIPMLDPENSFHMAANVYASGIDVYRAWGHIESDDSDGRRRHEEFILRFGCFDSNDRTKADFCTSCVNDGWIHRTSGCGTSSGFSTTRIRGTAWNLNHLIAHELGHNYYRRALGSERVLGLNLDHVWSGPRLDRSTIPVVVHDSTEKGNTEEGWCNFFAVATYFNANARHPYYRFCGDYAECPHSLANTKYDRRGSFGHAGNREFWAKFNLEGETWTRAYHMNNDSTPRADRSCGVAGASGGACVGACVGLIGTDRIDNPGGLEKMVWEGEGNVARFFWDLFDDTVDNDAPSLSYAVPEHNHGFNGNANTYTDRGDNNHLTRRELLDIWKSFPDHDSNRGRMEPFASSGIDAHGRNIVDYRRNAHYRVSNRYNFWGEYLTNCLLGQDPD